MTHSISLLTILKTIGSFLKKSLLFSLISGTSIYILMRLVFIGSEFDQREAIELYLKTCFVTWSYINAWRIICLGIVWIEKKTTTAKPAQAITMPLLKRTAILIIIAGLAGAVDAAGPVSSSAKKLNREWKVNRNIETGTDIDPKFHFIIRH